jgi:two-component system, NarL family, response regulator NreC
MSKFKVVVVEESPCFFQGIGSWLEQDKHFTLCHKLVGWDEMQEIGKSQAICVIITTLQWINLNPGIPAFFDFLKINQQLKVICFIRKPEEFSLPEIMTYGIGGIIDWTATHEEFLFGLQEVCIGKLYVSSYFPVVHSEKEIPEKKSNNKHHLTLTQRETEVLTLICEGLTDKEIADKLSVSKRTVDGYRANLLSKFGARNSTVMVKVALENHMV